MIYFSGVRGLPTAILMVYWLSAVSGLRLSAMSHTEMQAAVTHSSEHHNASHSATCVHGSKQSCLQSLEFFRLLASVYTLYCSPKVCVA